MKMRKGSAKCIYGAGGNAHVGSTVLSCPRDLNFWTLNPLHRNPNRPSTPLRLSCPVNHLGSASTISTFPRSSSSILFLQGGNLSEGRSARRISEILDHAAAWTNFGSDFSYQSTPQSRPAGLWAVIKSHSVHTCMTMQNYNVHGSTTSG